MTTWWKARKRYIGLTDRPEPVEATGETAKFIINKHGRRDAKETDWDTLHATKAEAWDALLDRATKEVVHAGQELAAAENRLAKLREARAADESPEDSAK